MMEQMDKNKDGKITKDELGDDRRASFILGRADSDGDGVVTKKGLEKMMAQFAGGRGGRGGRGGGPGGGRGGEGGAPGGARPKRPPADE